MWLIVLVAGLNPVQNDVAPAPLPGAGATAGSVARASSPSTTAATAAGMLMRGSGSYEAGGMKLGGLNHRLSCNIGVSSGGRTGRRLSRSAASEPDKLSGGAEFLILGAHALALQTKQSSRACGKLPELPATEGANEVVEPAARAGENLAHRSFGQSAQCASHWCAKCAAH